ncbi:hypothetical protein [Arthrobacter sunyaminii]|uniref:hypothetical protein n=1 Tax=Arthrobacter sunyaminii TaxID=2816859 RepID=UPI001F19FE27|nr:hypothetical protein [Arthrobacter sunyaminii]
MESGEEHAKRVVAPPAARTPRCGDRDQDDLGVITARQATDVGRGLMQCTGEHRTQHIREISMAVILIGKEHSRQAAGIAAGSGDGQRRRLIGLQPLGAVRRVFPAGQQFRCVLCIVGARSAAPDHAAAAGAE